MTHIVLRAAAVLLALGIGTLPASLFAQTPHVAIRMYDVAAADPDVRAVAMRTATTILDQAGVAVRWMDCSRGGADHPCHTVPGRRELLVRIMPVPEAGMIRSRDALSVPGIRGTPGQQLGFAVVGDGPRAGILATVYYENVQLVARSSGVPTGRLLGRAIAHEVGHLLLPPGGHSPSGLMRAQWAYAELMEDRRKDWVFSPQDRRQLRAALLLR